jgi:hypothetical protein
MSPDKRWHNMTHLAYYRSGLEEAPDLRQQDNDGQRSDPGLALREHLLLSPPLAITGSKTEEEEGDPWLRVHSRPNV